MSPQFPSLSRTPAGGSRRRHLLSLAVLGALMAGPASAQLPQAIRNFDRDNPATHTALPALLSQTGLYKNIASKARVLADTNAIVPFEVNSALWSDGSHKERFVAVPPGTKIVPTDTSHYTFPAKTVLIKNFAIDTVFKDSTTRILVETRFLVYQSDANGKRWSGFTYQWRRDQTDADLVSLDEGKDYVHNVRLNGALVGKRWRYPSMGDCKKCHLGGEMGDGNLNQRGTLGFITPQLNRANQLQRLVAKNVLTVNPLTGKTNPHRWYGLSETSATMEQRVRSYFASNCSHCHGNRFEHGQVNHDFDYFNPAKSVTYNETSNIGGIVNKPSTAQGGEYPWLVRSGHPDSSMILAKMMSRVDAFMAHNDEQMPPLATSQPDSAAIKLMKEWICSLKSGATNCQTPVWLTDDTYWDEPATPISIRHAAGRGKLDFRSGIRDGVLSVPAEIASAGRVTLSDSRGRRVQLVAAGNGKFRIASPLVPGVYILAAGSHRMYLHHLP